MKENWFALFICVISEKDISIDKSLIKMGISKECNDIGVKHMKYSDSEKEHITKLKMQGKTYGELGKMFGMTRSQVAGIVRYYKIKTTRTPTKVVQVAI